MMRRMVLGGGSNQLELLRKSREMGDFIVLVDYLNDCPGIEYSDVHLKISTFDVEKVSEACKEYRIDSIVTAGTDQPVYTAAVASKFCTHPFYLDDETALYVTNKKYMKKKFMESGIETAKFKFIKSDFSDDELKDVSFPIVMKPVDTQGQRGIFLVHSLEEIKQHIDKTLSFSRDDVVLIEEYYDNDEITVNGWVRDGELIILSVVDRVTIDDAKHIGICLCHNHPSLHLKNYQSEVYQTTKNIVESFKIKNGPIYFQYFVGEEGLLVNEIACRVGGAYEGITIPYLTDFDILDAVLRYPKKSTMRIDEHYYYETTKFLSTQLFFCKTGLIESIQGQSDVCSNENVLDFGLNFKIGETIPKLENAKARAGYFIVKGKSYRDMIQNVEEIYELLKVNKGNLVKNYLSYDKRYKYIKEDL